MDGRTKEDSKILINLLFSGSYLGEGNNIAHETINFIKPDPPDDESQSSVSYVYITPDGVVKDHGKIVDLDTVVFATRSDTAKTVEIVAVATGIKTIKADNGQIKFGGHEIENIFVDNIHNGEANPMEEIRYCAERVVVPSADKRVFISLDKEYYAPEFKYESEKQFIKIGFPQNSCMYITSPNDANGKQIANTSQRKFCKPDSGLYRIVSDLKKVIEKDIKDGNGDWIEIATYNKTDEDNSEEAYIPSFLTRIGKQDSELVFSNLLYYYFKNYPEWLQKFAEEVLEFGENNETFELEGLKIKREYNHIDLWIENEKQIIVIENKIFAGFGKYPRTGEVDEKFIQVWNELGCDTLEHPGHYSQLDHYYAEAMKEPKTEQKDKKFFVLKANHNTNETEDYDHTSVKYKTIYYSNLSNFFSKYEEEFMEGMNCQEQLYFQEFLAGIRRHAHNSYAELLRTEMEQRFRARIQSLDNE